MTFISPNKSVSSTNAQNRLLFFTEITTRCNTFHTAVHPKRCITNHTAVAGLLFLSISSNEPKQKFSFPFQQQVVVATFGKPKKIAQFSFAISLRFFSHYIALHFFLLLISSPSSLPPNPCSAYTKISPKSQTPFLAIRRPRTSHRTETDKTLAATTLISPQVSKRIACTV